MEIRPECYACLERLVELTVDLATSDPGLQTQARQAAQAIIAHEFTSRAIPALIANHIHRAIQEITANPDPFASRKTAQTALLARMAARLAPGYGEDQALLLKLAVTGNAVDFFRAEAEVSRDLASDIKFAISHLDRFRQRLDGPTGLLLYLADNAGEQFFDLPLVTYLRRQGWRVLYVVKGGPIQNDLTRDDLYASGLGEALEPLADTGAAMVGLVPSETSRDFQEIYTQAQIILAKGMGHFETMGHLQDPRVFFLL